MTDKVIWTTAKTPTSDLRLSLSEYEGRTLVHLRIWSGPEGGEMKATKTGVAFSVSLLPDLIAAMQKAQAEIEAAGL